MDEFTWLLRTVAKALVLPPGGPLLLAGVGLALLLRRRKRFGVALLGTGLSLAYLTATPIVAALLVRVASGGVGPLDQEAARTAQAVVILGGGLRRDAAEFGGDTLGILSLERVRYGARVARETGLPVLVSGGSVRGDTRAEAQLMREALEGEFGVAVRWVEDQSRNTRENADRSAGLLLAAGIRRVVIVMHAFDVPRVQQEFARAGLHVVPAPTRLPKLEEVGTVVADFLPSASALADSHYAIYELVAVSFPFLRA